VASGHADAEQGHVDVVLGHNVGAEAGLVDVVLVLYASSYY